jgi:hypothetical protein
MLGIQEGDEMSHNLTDHFELYFPMKKLFFLSKFTNGTRIEWKATNDIDIVLYNAVSREKRVLINGRPLLDQDNNNCSGSYPKRH